MSKESSLIIRKIRHGEIPQKRWRRKTSSGMRGWSLCERRQKSIAKWENMRRLSQGQESRWLTCARDSSRLSDTSSKATTESMRVKLFQQGVLWITSRRITRRTMETILFWVGTVYERAKRCLQNRLRNPHRWSSDRLSLHSSIQPQIREPAKSDPRCHKRRHQGSWTWCQTRRCGSSHPGGHGVLWGWNRRKNLSSEGH